MPIRRNRRNLRRRPRKNLRRNRRTMVARPIQKNIFHFKRTYQAPDISFSSSGATTGCYTPSLSLMPDVTDFTTLFDQYRINKFVVKFIPNFDGNSLLPTGFVSMPNIYYAVDHDDAVAPTTIDQLLQYPRMKIRPVNKITSVMFTPSTLSTVDATASSAIKYKQWINCAYTTIPHYGLKFYIDAIGVSQARFRVFVTTYFSMKDPR